MSDNLLQQIREMGFLQKAELLRTCLSELYREAYNTPEILVNQNFDVLKIPDAERRKNFGARLKALRQSLGFSQKELSAMLGVVPQHLCIWESGNQEPKLKYLIALAQSLKVSTDLLLGIERENVAEQDKKMEAGAYA